MEDKTNGEKLDALAIAVQALAAKDAAPVTNNVYKRVWDCGNLARVLLQASILAFTASVAIAFHNPNLIMLALALLATRRDKAPKQTTREQLEEINARLAMLADKQSNH